MARALTKRKTDGTLYVRPAAIERQIDEVSSLGLMELRQRLVVVDRKAGGYLHSETLVHLIRLSILENRPEVSGTILPVLLVRYEKNLKDTVSDDLRDAAMVREDILGEFSELLALDATTNPGLLDYYEVRFNAAFAAHRINVVRKEEAVPSVAEIENVSPAVSRALSRFQNCLHSVQTTAVSDSIIKTLHAVSQSHEAVNPFSHLNRGQYRGVAKNLDVNTVFLSKFRDRQVVPKSIPVAFQRRLAAEVDVPVELLIAHLSAPQGAPHGQLYKADKKPSNQPQQSFEEAVRGSGLDQEQQKALLEL